MDYIINPSWFYWLSVAEGAKFVCVALCVLAGLALTANAICAYIDDDGDARRRLKYITPCFIISLLAAVFIPGKDTLIEMQVAKIATVDNAKLTVDTLKSAVDYIVNAISSLK